MQTSSSESAICTQRASHTAVVGPWRDRPADETAQRTADGRGPSLAMADSVAATRASDWVRRQRVTVLMATYNRSHLIRESLDSLLGQSRPVDELIVIDDGCTDATPDIVARYRVLHPARLRYVRKPNGGLASALNRGLAEATGDWIWVFDDDDAALPAALASLLERLSLAPELDFVYGGLVTGASGPDGRIVTGRTVLPADIPAERLFAASLRKIPFLLPATLMRRSAVERAGGFNESYPRSHDYDFVLRLLKTARGARVPAPVFVWRSHDGPRGPASVQHDSAKRERVWMEMAGRLGRELRGTLALGDYLPGTASSDATGLRCALLQRMAVMASKGLVRELLADLRSACRAAAPPGGAGLDPLESMACRDVAAFQFFQMRLFDAPERLTRRLLAAADGATGRLVLAAIGRGLVHCARHPDRSGAERRAMLRCALRLFLASGPGACLRAYRAPRSTA